MKSETVSISVSCKHDAMETVEKGNISLMMYSFRQSLFIPNGQGFRFPSAFVFSLFTLLLLSACNEAFQPLSESDKAPLSIYGYLDASADTQWVRVTPIREQLDMSPVKPEMEVTLEHIQSGNSEMMNDSLLLFPDGINILNAWTTMDIEPGQTYRLLAKRPDGAASSVSVTIPGKFPTVNMQFSMDGCLAILNVDQIEHLADIQSRWLVQAIYITEGVVTLEEERFFSIPHKNRAVRIADGNYTVQLNTHEERSHILSQFLSPPVGIRVIRRDVFIASAGPEWVEGLDSMDDLLYTLSDGFSNVENGLGYLIGIASETIPWDRC